MKSNRFQIFLYQKDYSERGQDRYFIKTGSGLVEVDSCDINETGSVLFTHDYWLISPSLYKAHEKLPSNVVDVVLFEKVVSGIKREKKDRKLWEISKCIKKFYEDVDKLNKYFSIFYRKDAFEKDIYDEFSEKILLYVRDLITRSKKNGEFRSFFSTEISVFNDLTTYACKGVNVDNSRIREYKKKLRVDYYRLLKEFAEKHSVLYEFPLLEEIKDKLETFGYNTPSQNQDFFQFLENVNEDYIKDYLKLRKVYFSHNVFNSISSRATRLRSIVESHWTSTGRIHLFSPSVQNIAKQYRDIIIPDRGFSLCYIDYDQFEVGVIAALSNDPVMIKIYQEDDAYAKLAVDVFGQSSYRKQAKKIFLSYLYGMSITKIKNIVSSMGGNIKVVENFFSNFISFENWKVAVCNKFEKEGRISTLRGNYLKRSQSSDLSSREKRVAVNHVAQGSATYIFKNVLIKLGKVKGLQILLPMHDAVLFQHKSYVDIDMVLGIFEKTMSNILDNKIRGKARVSKFYDSD